MTSLDNENIKQNIGLKILKLNFFIKIVLVEI